MALLKKKGYGQIEPNHLSGQRNGQIYAQLPAKADIEVLENSQFAKYDYAAGEVNFTGEGEWMLVYNEVKLYDPKHSYKDFAFKREDFTDNQLFPRVFKTMPGDLFTTNLVDVTGELTVGTHLAPKEGTGILTEIEQSAVATTDMVWKIVKVYTLADMQPAVKVQRIK